MIKNRCSPVSLVLFSAIGAFLIGAVSAQAGDPSAAAGASANRSSTPQVSPVEPFAINPNPNTCNPATDPSCPFYDVCVSEAGNLNHPSCTANDVKLTEIVEGSLQVLADLDGGIGCDGGSDAADPRCPSDGDCVTFTATGHYVLTTQARYDIGTFIETDLDANGDGARSGTCLRFAYALADTTNLEAATNALDICGDLDQSHGGLPAGIDIPFGPVTVPCIADANANIVINHCETWAQRGAELDCRGSDDVRAGTGSKCNCGVLSGICIAVNSGDACITNVCEGTCQNSTGGGSGTTCGSSADCTAPETCRDIALVGHPVGCADQTSGQCDNPDTCVNGACQPNHVLDGTVCYADHNQCTADLCENGVCVAGAGGSVVVPE